MRWARKSSPQIKRIVVENPHLTLPAEVFQLEVEDYLLMPFTAMELFTRVDRCFNGNRVDRGNTEEKAEQINANAVNSFRHKIRNIHIGLLSLKANINMLIDQGLCLLHDGNVGKVREISHDLLILTRLTENILYNMLICCNENDVYSMEKAYTMDYFNQIKFTQFN
jgi:hypothetical protein